jgi:hypothetical protein
MRLLTFLAKVRVCNNPLSYGQVTQLYANMSVSVLDYDRV